MDAYNLHLLLNYYPVAGSVAGLLLLLAGLWRKSEAIKRIGLWTTLAVAVVVLPVYVSGEITGAAYPAAAGDLIRQHRSTALPAFGFIEAAGIAAIAALLLMNRRPGHAQWLVWFVLAMALLGSVFLARTALAGRQIKWGSTPGVIENSKIFFKRINIKTTERGEQLWLA